RVGARVASEPVAGAPDRVRVVLDVQRVDDIARTGTISLTLYGPPAPLGEGQRIAVDARLDRPVGFRDPGVFDAAARLAREDIHVTGSASSTRVVPLEPPSPSWPAAVPRPPVAPVVRPPLPAPPRAPIRRGIRARTATAPGGPRAARRSR